MPSDKKKAKQTKLSAFDFADEKESIPAEEAAPTKSRKRSTTTQEYSDDDSEQGESATRPEPGTEVEMASILNNFGAEMSKTLSAKRKRLATFTSASLKTSNRKYDEIFVTQQTEREKMNEEFGKQIGSVFSQWESDIVKSKEAEEKLEAIIRQLQKTLQQQRVVQNQRLKSLKTLTDQYLKGTQELGKVHKEHQTNINGELRKEFSSLQKKMIDDARQEEISNMRKSLHNMFSC